MVLLLAKDHDFAPAQGSVGAMNQTLGDTLWYSHL
jgi:hypothetical protein